MTQTKTMAVALILAGILIACNHQILLVNSIRVIYINNKTDQDKIATGNMISAPNTCGPLERLDTRNRCRKV